MSDKTLLKEIFDELVYSGKVKSQSEFARVLGDYTRGYMSGALKAEDIPFKMQEKLNEVFGVSFEFMRNGTKPMFEAAEKSAGDNIRLKKAIGDTDDPGLIYVPIAAQAGYTRNYTDPIYINQLERLYIPGLPYKGDSYRYFDVEGDSMYPTLEDGMQVIAQRVDPEFWHSISDFYIHVIVCDSQILIKRLYRVNESEFVMISDNEDLYPQVRIAKRDIKELWLVKRKLDWKMMPPKNYEIKA